jgi:hypothetical protein
MTLLQLHQEKVKQPQVFVLQEVPQGIGNLGIPYVYPKGIKPEPGHMIDVLPDGSLRVDAEGFVGAVGICKGHGIIDPEEGGLLVAFCPPEDACPIDVYKVVLALAVEKRRQRE